MYFNNLYFLTPPADCEVTTNIYHNCTDSMLTIIATAKSRQPNAALACFLQASILPLSWLVKNLLFLFQCRAHS